MKGEYFMKKLMAAVIAFLLIWNIGLSLEMGQLKEDLQTTKESIPEAVETQEGTAFPSETVQVSSQISSDTTEVIKQVRPAVVTVLTRTNEQQVGTGSGVVYNVQDNISYIITNHHVISSGSTFEIAYLSGEVVEAELIGSDQYADLALLKVTDGPTVTPLQLGDSSVLTVGEVALAIGSPAGENFAGSVTQGIISGVDRTLAVDTDNDGLEDWDMILIQTDAAINPGNSGGALVNMKGQLIGINTTKIAGTAYEGMGFAIPVNEVISIINQIQTTGEVYRPHLGIRFLSLSDLSYAERNYFNWTMQGELPADTEGLLITEVIADSASDKAGLKSGDIILSIDNQEIDNFRQFRRILYSFDRGSSINLLIKRDGQIQAMKIQLQ